MTQVQNPFQLPEILEEVVFHSDFATLKNLRLTSTRLNELARSILLQRHYISLDKWCDSEESCEKPQNNFYGRTTFNLKLSYHPRSVDALKSFMNEVTDLADIREIWMDDDHAVYGKCGTGRVNKMMKMRKFWTIIQPLTHLKVLHHPSVYGSSDPGEIQILGLVDRLEVGTMNEVTFNNSIRLPKSKLLNSLVVYDQLNVMSEFMATYLSHPEFQWKVRTIQLSLTPTLSTQLTHEFLTRFSKFLENLKLEFWDFPSQLGQVVDVGGGYVPASLTNLKKLSLGIKKDGPFQLYSAICTGIDQFHLPQLRHLELDDVPKSWDGQFENYFQQLSRAPKNEWKELTIGPKFYDGSLFCDNSFWQHLQKVVMKKVHPGVVSNFFRAQPQQTSHLILNLCTYDHKNEEVSWDSVLTGINVDFEKGNVYQPKRSKLQPPTVERGPSIRNLKKLQVLEIRYGDGPPPKLTDHLVHHGLLEMECLESVTIEFGQITESAIEALRGNMGPRGVVSISSTPYLK